MAKKQKGELRIQAELQSKAKRINTRIQAIADTFGTESETYKKAISILIGDKYEDFVHYKKSGVIAISQSGTKLSSSEGKNMLRGLNMSVKTFSEYKKKAMTDNPDMFKGLSGDELKQRIVDVTEDDTKVVNEFTATRDAFYKAYTESEQRTLMPELFGGDGKPDWDTLDKWKETMEKWVADKNEDYVQELLKV